MAEENEKVIEEQPIKKTWWKTVNKKMVSISVAFLMVGFISGYQVSGMNNQAGSMNQERTSDGTTNTMERGNSGPNQGEAPPDRPDGADSDAVSGATENEGDELDGGTTSNQSNNTSSTTTEDVL